MSIRLRLVAICLVVSLLPAIPVSFLVKTLLEKSFDVGLNKTVEGALQSGLTISREHVDWLESQLDLIDKVGIENYLITQVGDEDEAGH